MGPPRSDQPNPRLRKKENGEGSVSGAGVDGGDVPILASSRSGMDALPLVKSLQEDVVITQTPAFILKWSPMIDHVNWLISWPVQCLGIAGLCFQAYTKTWYGPFFWVQCLLLGYAKNILTNGFYHRFFSHLSFQCSRPVAFILGIITLSGGQKGPLWWSSKHRRHHKFCENAGPYPQYDPHSPYRASWLYAAGGWTMSAKERYIDWDFVHPQFKTWEMLLVEALTWPYFLAEGAAVSYLLSWKYNMMDLYGTIMWYYLTLLINYYIHYDGKPEEEPVNGRYKCHATNTEWLLMKWPLDLLGETAHADHHKNPRRAKRLTKIIDPFYWVVIKPCEWLGIFWDVKA